MKRLSPQCAAVLRLLREHHEGVTPRLAREEAGCDRLAARIWELRHLHGYDIEERAIVVPSRHAGTSRIGSYRIVEAKPQQLALDVA
jgi:hypothetical protein